jgi:glycerate dehydrogenase
MERIVFLDRSTLNVALRRPRFAHEWREFAETKPEEVVERLQGASITIANKVNLRDEHLAQLPQLKFIAIAATGVNNIDLESCRKRAILVSNVRGYARHSVAEHVFMLMLALRRKLTEYRGDVERGAWAMSSQFCLLNHTIRDLRRSTLGIVGYGSIGRAVEKLARAFGMQVIVAEHKSARMIRPGRMRFDEVLSASDILTLHVPLTAETKNLIGAPELACMKPDALLINTGRGGLVDEQALADALRARRLGGAGFDVLMNEPPREGNALLDANLPNLIVTPHNAWASREALAILAEQLIANLEAFVRHEPQNLVT